MRNGLEGLKRKFIKEAQPMVYNRLRDNCLLLEEEIISQLEKQKDNKINKELKSGDVLTLSLSETGLSVAIIPSKVGRKGYYLGSSLSSDGEIKYCCRFKKTVEFDPANLESWGSRGREEPLGLGEAIVALSEAGKVYKRVVKVL